MRLIIDKEYTLTTEHPASSYGIPVLLVAGKSGAFGPSDDPDVGGPDDLFGGVPSPFGAEGQRSVTIAVDQAVADGRVFSEAECVFIDAFAVPGSTCGTCPSAAWRPYLHLSVEWGLWSKRSGQHAWLATPRRSTGEEWAGPELVTAKGLDEISDPDLVAAAAERCQWPVADIRVVRPA